MEMLWGAKLCVKIVPCENDVLILVCENTTTGEWKTTNDRKDYFGNLRV